MFQAVLITVITYLVACYGYGLYLLWKLYTGRRFNGEAVAERSAVAAMPQAKPAAMEETYQEPRAKAA